MVRFQRHSGLLRCQIIEVLLHIITHFKSREIGLRCMKLQNPPLVHSLVKITNACTELGVYTYILNAYVYVHRCTVCIYICSNFKGCKFCEFYNKLFCCEIFILKISLTSIHFTFLRKDTKNKIAKLSCKLPSVKYQALENCHIYVQ